MSLRDRTKKRLRWALTALVIVVVGGGIGYVARDRHLEKVALSKRDEGLRLLEAGDHFQALHKIGPYLRRHPNEIDAIFAYARARQEVPEPQEKHIAEALKLYRRVLSLDPQHMGAAEAALRLYQRYGLWTEALQLSEDVLRIDRQNRVGLESRATALFALGRFDNDEALNAALEYNQAHPKEIRGQLLTLEILQRGGSSRDRVLSHCKSLLEQFPQDPQFMLLSGIAHATVGDAAAAKQWLEQASAGEMPDAASLRLLVDYCDRLGMFDRSIDVLQRHGKRGGEFAALLTGRLWELERYDEVVEQVDEAAARTPHAAALRCLSMHRLGRKDEAARAATAMRALPARDASARAWIAVVEAVVVNGEAGDAALIAACEQALKQTKDAHLQFELADAYRRAGDAETAVDLWQQVAGICSSWSAPLVHLSGAALSAGHFDEAVQLAEAALARKPDNVRAMLVLVRAQASRSPSLDEAGAAKVLSMLDRVAELAPEEPTIVPLRVQTLGLSGRKADAIAAVRAATAPSSRTSSATLIHLATVSGALRLGVEDECIARCEQLHGVSYDLAFLKARRAIDAGRKAQGLELFEKARSAALAQEKASWDAGWARLLEMTGDPRAKGAWIALADGSPNDSLVQWLALSARSVQGEREFIGRVLARLRERMGDQGLSWRLTQARWLLSGEGSQNAVEAALILNDLTRSAPRMLAPRLLLADCLLKLGNASGAIDQLTAAANLQPQSSAIALQLGRLLHSRGETARARIHLDRVLENRAATLAEMRDAAALVEAQGDSAAALAAMERAYGEALNEPPADVLLASLYRATNQIERTDAICKRLVEKGEVSGLAFAADFYTAAGRTADAQAALEKLKTVPSEPGVKEIIFGSHALRAGDRAAAIEYFKSAVAAAPKNPVGWRQLIRMHLMTENEQAALATARDAAAVLPEDLGVASFIRQAPAAVQEKGQWPELLAMLSDLLDAPDNEQAVTAALELLRSGGGATLSSSAVTDLVSLASSRSDSFSLQVLAARACLQAGRTDTACLLVRRAAELRSEAFGFAVQTLVSADRWSEVAELFRPKLNDPKWRHDWMRFAANVLPDQTEAVSWLVEVEPHIKAGDLRDRLSLAEAWRTLAQRMRDKSISARAAEHTRRVAAEVGDNPPTADAAWSLACLQEAQGEIDAAETCYRKALEMNPQLTVAQNNLAMLLARHGRDLDEALRLATQATASSDPNVVSFYDTLAFVQMQRKEYDAALNTLTKALQLKPDHLWCQVRLTDALMQSGQVEKARATLTALEKDLPDRGVLPSEMTARLEDLRSRLAQGSS